MIRKDLMTGDSFGFELFLFGQKFFFQGLVLNDIDGDHLGLDIAFAGVLVESESEAVRGEDASSRISAGEHGVGTCGSFGFCAADGDYHLASQ